MYKCDMRTRERVRRPARSPPLTHPARWPRRLRSLIRGRRSRYDRRCALSQAWRSWDHLPRERAPPQRQTCATSITNPTEPWESLGEICACLACQREFCPASLLRAGPHQPDSC